MTRTRTIAFASRALAEVGEDEWRLRSDVREYLAVAEWLCGRLAEAERAFGSSIAGGGPPTRPTGSLRTSAITSA